MLFFIFLRIGFITLKLRYLVFQTSTLMKTLRKLSFAILFASLLVMDSCLPLDEVVPDRIPALTSGTWVFSEITNGDDFHKDFYSVLFDGQRVTFSDDGTYSQNLAIYNLTGNWTLNADQTILHYDVGTSEAQDREILTLTNSEFHFRVNFTGTIVDVRFTH